jgi:protein-disulfide isomerase
VACANRGGDDFSATQVTQIQAIVHDYLVTHPEVLVEASQALQQKQLVSMQSKAAGATIANKAILLTDKVSPVAGNPQGSITLVEFFDYQCPHCIDMEPVVAGLIKANPDLRVVFKEFPIFGDVSDYAARMSLAAYKQGRYIKFNNALLEANKKIEMAHKSVTHADIDNVAKKVGLNLEQAKKVLRSDAFTNELKQNRTLAGNLSLVGTPAFVVLYTDPAKNTEASSIGFVPGQTDEATLQGLISKLK